MLEHCESALIKDGKIAKEKVRIHHGLAGILGPDELYSLGIAKEKTILGFLPIWTTENILDIRISPSPRKSVKITVYSEQGFALAQSECKETSYGFIRWSVNITEAFRKNPERKGSLSLVTRGGELSPTTQEKGALAIVENK